MNLQAANLQRCEHALVCQLLYCTTVLFKVLYCKIKNIFFIFCVFVKHIICVKSCCSVTKSHLTLCDPMDCSCWASLSFTISQSLLKLMSIKSVMTSNHLVLCRPLLLSSVFPSTRIFSMSLLFASGGQIIGASASTSVLPMNIQG